MNNGTDPYKALKVPGLLYTLPSHNRQPPGRIQQRLLRRLLRRASNTEWGRQFGFESLAGRPELVRAYQDRVPLCSYDTLREDINQVRAGCSDILWPGKTQHFAVSSGTTSAGKIIPVSQDMLRMNRRFTLEIALSYFFNTGNIRLFTGKHLALPGYIEEDSAYPGTIIGEVSGLQSLFAPKLYGLLQALPTAIIREPDWDRKLHAIAERAIGLDVRLVAMAPSWAVVLFQIMIDRYNAQHERKVSTIGEIWPNLQLYISGGVALSSYRTLLEQQIGRSDMDFLEVYGASEGFFSLQTMLGDTSMLLHLNNGVFFEFIRLHELHAPQPTRYTIEEVEFNERYVPVLTTCSGLWAYVLGDVIRFTHLSPHKIVVAGRTSDMLDLYGEAVFGEEVQQSMTEACSAASAHLREYHVTTRAPDADRMPAMECLIEFDQPPLDPQHFIRTLDSHLIRTNRHYAIRREARAFAPPELITVPVGTFHDWLRRTRSAVGSQSKVPRLSEIATVRDGILSVAGEQACRIPLNGH